jgi:hypothetical protein
MGDSLIVVSRLLFVVLLSDSALGTPPVAEVPGFAAEPAGPEVVAVGVPERAGPAAELAAEPAGSAAGVPESLLIFNCRYQNSYRETDARPCNNT